ncbi:MULTISPECIES: GMC family oxidoreductase N-terminal domain-containing protein [Aeromicrobium]|uniref:GMC family oxidoreductase N-terminal domain-containing protein n=1 Tax=Aeromicrobium TaxID=2040 RepID=UPI001CA89581|nr:GMC family oxidoreductase N-terminal domain-containing protein [Aeromicrobium sp. 636]
MPDVVVVGGGGSGIPLAVRLAGSGASVLLLEEGQSTPESLAALAHGPWQVLGAQMGHPATRAHPVDLTGARPWGVTRGKVLGGSTAVNGGYFVRARTSDFDAWARAGGERWRSDAVLPLLRRLESDVAHGSTPVHGDSGPMPVDRAPLEHPACQALLTAADALGIAWDPDKNDSRDTGVGAVPTNVADGHRVSTARGYLTDGLPSGLTIRGDTRVLRVRLVAGRAMGVETTAGFVPAGRVVLCAGALGSAQLLMLSGVGPADDLRRAGVTVAADLPVGVAVSDHPQVVVDWPASSPLPRPSSWLGAVIHATSPGSTREGNVELLQSLLPMESLVAGSAEDPGLSLVVADTTPQNRGSVRLRSSDPDDDVLVDLGYLRDEADRGALRHGVRLAASLLGSSPLSTAGRPGVPDGILCEDRLLDAWIEERLGTAMHLCASAPMGQVVAGDGSVYGTEDLHVADTSILPSAPLRGPANTAVLIGELVAEAIAGR